MATSGYRVEDIVLALSGYDRETRRYAALMLGIRRDANLVGSLVGLLESGETAKLRNVGRRPLCWAGPCDRRCNRFPCI